LSSVSPGGDPSAGRRAGEALREIAALLALEKGNRFRSRAYAQAADVIEAVPDLEGAVADRQLLSLPGIGQAIAAVVQELAQTGRSKLLERLRSRYPPGAAELSRVLTPARIRTLQGALGITSLEELKRACEEGRVREVRGFGEKSERRLRERIAAGSERRRDALLPRAVEEAEALCRHLRRSPAVAAALPAGDLRRRRETVDRLELVVASREPAAVAAQARRAPGLTAVEEQAAEGFVLRRAGMLDARVHSVPPARFPLALVEATGSEAHVAALLELARRKGLRLDEQGAGGADLGGDEQVYARLGLEYVPPEMREGSGEVEAAAAGTLPRQLVEASMLQGAVHCHTEYSDGRHSIERMARAAEALGLRYLTITDHSVSAPFANGLDLDRLQRQAEEIARVQEQVSIRLLRGTEADILQDGALDYSLPVLEKLDVVIASVHRRHGMDRREMTARIVRALRQPVFKIWGHPLGRYVLSRPPIDCDMDEVLDAAAASRAAIEVNGDPHRLDLPPAWIREAKKRGIPFVLSSDAHSAGGLGNARWAADMARRGWLEGTDVLNTLGPDEFAQAVHP
jgi:DNA polymerase (family 10)